VQSINKNLRCLIRPGGCASVASQPHGLNELFVKNATVAGARGYDLVQNKVFGRTHVPDSKSRHDRADKKVTWPYRATPEDERVALDCRMVAFDNRTTKRNGRFI